MKFRELPGQEDWSSGPSWPSSDYGWRYWVGIGGALLLVSGAALCGLLSVGA